MQVRYAGYSVAKAMFAAAAIGILVQPAASSPSPALDATGAEYGPPILIFFEKGNAEIAPSARPLANRALAGAVGAGNSSIRIDAAARAGEDDSARALAKERARNVESFLTANGVPGWRIEAVDVTMTEPLDPAFTVAEERVEIRFRSRTHSVVAEMSEQR